MNPNPMNPDSLWEKGITKTQCPLNLQFESSSGKFLNINFFLRYNNILPNPPPPTTFSAIHTIHPPIV